MIFMRAADPKAERASVSTVADTKSDDRKKSSTFLHYDVALEGVMLLNWWLITQPRYHCDSVKVCVV